jgi:hypothetical protein
MKGKPLSQPINPRPPERTGKSRDGRGPDQWCNRPAEGCGEPCVREPGHGGECECGCGTAY